MHYQSEGLGPYITGHSYADHMNLLTHQNDFDDNLLMDELDIDELLECDDIEQTAFINSSKQLLSVIDNVINSIDDRISYKRNAFYGGAVGYYGMGGNTAAPGYHPEDFGMSTYS